MSENQVRGRPKKSDNEVKRQLPLRANKNDREMLERDFDGSVQAAFDFFIARHRDKMSKRKFYRSLVKAFVADSKQED